jgi:predicted nucleic acid-binding protein
MPVIDASVVVDWIAPAADPDSTAMRVLSRLSERSVDVLAPRLMPQEVANALLTGVRRGRWSGADADASFTILRRLPMSLLDDAVDIDRAWELSRRYDQHPVYDMIYVALAERLGAPLVTADDRLLRAVGSFDFVISPREFTAD